VVEPHTPTEARGERKPIDDLFSSPVAAKAAVSW
jgi:hypothetical protein